MLVNGLPSLARAAALTMLAFTSAAAVAWNTETRTRDPFREGWDRHREAVPQPPGDPLLDAAAAGNLALVTELVRTGADIRAKDADGFTALFLASRGGHVSVVEFLLAKGADPNAKGSSGISALESAASRGDLAMARLLLEKGAEVDIRDENQDTPLHKSCELSGHLDVARLLLDKGADPNARGQYGATPLHRVAVWGNANIAQLLVEKGSNTELKNDLGDTALDCALKKGNSAVADALRKTGSRGKEREPPLIETHATGKDGTPEVRLRRHDQMFGLVLGDQAGRVNWKIAKNVLVQKGPYSSEYYIEEAPGKFGDTLLAGETLELAWFPPFGSSPEPSQEAPVIEIVDAQTSAVVVCPMLVDPNMHVAHILVRSKDCIRVPLKLRITWPGMPPFVSAAFKVPSGVPVWREPSEVGEEFASGTPDAGASAPVSASPVAVPAAGPGANESVSSGPRVVELNLLLARLGYRSAEEAAKDGEPDSVATKQAILAFATEHFDGARVSKLSLDQLRVHVEYVAQPLKLRKTIDGPEIEIPVIGRYRIGIHPRGHLRYVIGGSFASITDEQVKAANAKIRTLFPLLSVGQEIQLDLLPDGQGLVSNPTPIDAGTLATIGSLKLFSLGANYPAIAGWLSSTSGNMIRRYDEEECVLTDVQSDRVSVAMPEISADEYVEHDFAVNAGTQIVDDKGQAVSMEWLRSNFVPGERVVLSGSGPKPRGEEKVKTIQLVAVGTCTRLLIRR